MTQSTVVLEGGIPALQRRKPVLPTHVSAPHILNVFGYYDGNLAHSFQALIGPQPPTIIDGGPQVSVVQRPRSLGYSMPTGYAPIQMQVQLRFENLTAPINPDLEGDLQKLWWMAGRGHLGPGTPSTGNPPIIKLAAYNTGNSEIPIIPPDVQGFEWIMSGTPSYDPAPQRLTQQQLNARAMSGVPVATRSRQDVTLTLMEWIPAPGFQTLRRAPTNAVVTKTAQAPYNTVRSMSQHYFDRDTVADYKSVMQLSANKRLKLTNPGKVLANGTVVRFPSWFLEG